MPQTASFACTNAECEREFVDVLPEFLHVEAWPVCCGLWADLLEVCHQEGAGEGEIKEADMLDASPPLSGTDDFTP